MWPAYTCIRKPIWVYSLGERKGVYWVPGLLVVWLIILRNAPQRWLSPERRKQRFLVSSVHSLIASYDHLCLRPSYRHWEHRSELGRPDLHLLEQTSLGGRQAVNRNKHTNKWHKGRRQSDELFPWDSMHLPASDRVRERCRLGSQCRWLTHRSLPGTF